MNVGKKIKKLRKDRNITLEQLSKKSGVALATLSRIENNKMRGTMHSHLNICKALNVSISDLYKELENEDKTIDSVQKDKHVEHIKFSSKSSYQLLVTKTTEKKILPLILKLEEDGETQPEKNSPNIEKFIYVITGTIRATIENTSYDLKTGDSLYFDASLNHIFKNISKKKAEALCIIAPPEIK